MEPLEPLRLRLSRGVDEAHFRVGVSVPSQFGGGETESKLPFFENGVDWLSTVRNALGANKFVPDHFQRTGEQDWMVQNGLLSEDQIGFHPDIQANSGRALYQALFPDKSSLNKALHKAISLAQTQEIELHVQLQIDANVIPYARLHDYPWELVHDGQDFLAHNQVTFSRYIDCDAVPPKLLPFKQINVLLVSSEAFDLKNDLEKLSKDEQEAVRQVLRKAQNKNYIRLNELKPATLRELRAYLTEHRGDEVPHVIHFDGHGFFGTRCKVCGEIYEGTKSDKCAQPCGTKLPKPQGYLLFEDKGGKANYVSAKELGTLLGKQRGLALVVLSACKSGLSLGSNSVFNGVAQNLISQRIPAVVAMQYSVLVDDATAFAEQFYRSLGERDSLAIAVSQGREAMGCEGNQWYRPVLYLRWKDNEGGQLFAAQQEPVLPNIEQLLQELLNQGVSASSLQPSGEITNEIKNLIKPIRFFKLAEKWLEDENYRWNLASNIAKAALQGKSLGIYATLQAKEKAENDFKINLFTCLYWLLDSFKNGNGKDIDDFKEYLIEHPLGLYVDALYILKSEAKKHFREHTEVICIVNHHLDVLINKILL
jgi:CHAT domain-containing protein